MSDILARRWRLAGQLALDGTELSDAHDGDLGAFGVRRHRCEEIPPGMGPARDFHARGGAVADKSGDSLHLSNRIAAHDRKRLERVCKYLSHPPIAEERLRWLPGGHIAISTRTRRRGARG